MISARWASCVVDSSSSAKWGTSTPVSASTRTVGDELTTSESAMWSGSGSPVTVAPGMWVSGPTPGEKPSERRQTAGLVWVPVPGLPEPDRGSVVLPKATCLCVGVDGSSASHTFDGKGKPHSVGTSGSQSVVSSGPPSAPASAPACDVDDPPEHPANTDA